MSVILKRTVLVVLLLVVLLLAAGVYLVNDSMPSLPKRPEAPVLAMPPQADFAPGAPYDGPHPRLSARPPEHFDFPIAPGETGPVEPLFAGERQYPFYCGADGTRAPDAQVLPDNQEGYGVPVFAVDNGLRDPEQVIGYSMDCSYPVQVRYFYKRQGTGEFHPLEAADGDIEQITVDGNTIDYVVRLETGTINRFIYAIAALRGPGETAAEPRGDYWNDRLIYQFRGGVGVGRNQGNFYLSHVLNERDRQLQQGYAVVYSTGNQTRNHFNMQLAEDTARRVKRQFTALYGEPEHTIGIGGSGGAIQQYLLAQNAPGLIDAAIALYAYPDVATQTIHIQDCELLEHFMLRTDRDNPLWQSWENRSLVQGLNADSQASNRFAPVQRVADFLRGNWSRLRGLSGSSECINGWRGLTPLMTNPHFVDNEPDYAPEVVEQVNWTYWDDLVQIFGRDEHGHAHNTWDNTGVQYGLRSLRDGNLPLETFLELNASVGGWKPQHEMEEEQFWFLTGGFWPVTLSLTSEHNMLRPPADGEPAPRSSGSREAMAAAYRSGQVFTGFADIPILDVRHYLAPELDMHHSLASFTARSRIQRAMGTADHQLIWVSERPHDPQEQAFEVVEQWLANRRRAPGASAAQTRPEGATDRCYDSAGGLIASGDKVWDGDWNGRSVGECMQQYPIYRTSRQVAGEGMAADVFRCHLQSVDEAIEAGLYGDLDMSPHRATLQRIFPQGVCDYSRGDASLPDGLMEALRQSQKGTHVPGSESAVSEQ